MRVLHVSSEATWRGGEQQMAYLIEELRAQGAQNVVAVKRGSAFEKWCQNNNIPFRSLPFRFALDPATIFGLKRLAKEERIDLIHLHTGKGHSIAYLSAKLGLKTPMVVSRRVDFPVRPSSARKYDHASIRRILCVSNAIAEMVRPAIQEPAKCVVVHSGIDLSRFEGLERNGSLLHELSLAAGTPLIGNVAALAPHKDLYTFVETAKVLVDSGSPAHFVLIGEGDERPALEARISDLGLAERVHLLGFRTNVPQLLRELDVFLITSKTEGLGTSVLDAFASEVPVVATAAGGIPEMVDDSKTGLLAPIGDAAALAEAVSRVIEDNTLAQELVTGAKEKLQSFDKTQTAAQTLTVYREVLSQSN